MEDRPYRSSKRVAIFNDDDAVCFNENKTVSKGEIITVKNTQFKEN